MISFKYWTSQQVEDTFGINRQMDCPLLLEWLNMPQDISLEEKNVLALLRDKLRIYADSWNEEELKLKFIAPILNLVDYETATYNTFANRKLSFKHGEDTISGNVDLMVASGRYEPKAPYFCFHEYKKEKGTSETDPRGQLLITMLAAQDNNKNDKPLYGCYVIGRLWFFVVLYGKTYCFSDDFSANTEALYDIYAALKNLKTIIQQNLAN